MAGIRAKTQYTAHYGCSKTYSRDGSLIENSNAQELKSQTKHGKLDQFHGNIYPMEVENLSHKRLSEAKALSIFSFIDKHHFLVIVKLNYGYHKVRFTLLKRTEGSLVKRYEALFEKKMKPLVDVHYILGIVIQKQLLQKIHYMYY